MSVFTTLTETRQLGAPVISLFQTALGRNPGTDELASYVSMVRKGAGLRALAGRLIEAPDFQRLHGTACDAEFVDTLYQHISGKPDPDASRALLGAGLGSTQADLLAVVASAALALDRVPLLPGLTPGAPPDDQTSYQLWVNEYDRPGLAGLPQPVQLDGIEFQVAISAGDTEVEAVSRTVESLQAQTHPGWTLWLAARTLSPWSRQAIAELARGEPRVRLVPSAPVRCALEAAHGSLVCLLAPGDRLPPAALHDVAAAFSAHPHTRLLFTDEDVAAAGLRHSPRFKPGFSREVVEAGNSPGQLTVYRRELLAGIVATAGESLAPDSYAREASLAVSDAEIRHLPAVLCHRKDAPAPAVGSEPRRGGAGGGDETLVSVVVLTKDRPELLAACTSGVLEQTAYRNLELLVVDNGSTDPDAVAALLQLEQRPRVRVLRRPGAFNFAALNNDAASQARGEILLLLNNDVEVLDPDWLAEMVAQAVRPSIGIVGARLLYPGGTVQHAGILLGPDGAATHVGRGAEAGDPGYLHQLACARDMSAVTGACLAVRASVWREVGGMDERLAVTWNDVDLCLRVRRAGLRVLWTPHATLLHKEGSTRGREAEDRAGQDRFRTEQALVRETWGDAVDRDPFLNPNLVATEAGLLALTRPRGRPCSVGAPV